MEHEVPSIQIFHNEKQMALEVGREGGREGRKRGRWEGGREKKKGEG